MSEMITGLTRGGAAWTPEFIVAINQKECIGCGRCYKVCPRNVFELVEREGDDEDEDDDFSDDVAMVMTIVDALDCIGCGSCARVCSKKCHSHAAAALSA
ncbi:ferredoxin III, nif-specific [Sulfurivermis fontis]|uniref:ferredoxin III, nif-specific n=1 Tax=Sulfurivermis fontis TaxID=1972068 RepID=UPI000FDC708E|nr:ferredoxin III, nif-specific [Sulfurivermis fontis]